MPTAKAPHHWGDPPWRIDFTPAGQILPAAVDFAIVGAGFTGLATAAWLKFIAPEKSVVVLEAARIGAGASGRTGGMALAETAAGDLPALGNVLAGFENILSKLGVDCDLSLPGAWEIGRSNGIASSPIQWNDSGTLRVVKEVPGGTIDPGKLVGGLARAAQERGAIIVENARVERIFWGSRPELEVSSNALQSGKITAGKILLATNALSLRITGLAAATHPRLTLAAVTEPLKESELAALGLAERKPFYTVDLPYLWGRVRRDNSIVWGAGLVQAPESGALEQVDIAAPESSRLFASLEDRLRHLHPALDGIGLTHRWGGPILFQESWQPVFAHHTESKNAIVLGAFAGHGVALSSYLGAWAAEVLLGRRDLPKWGAIPGRAPSKRFP